MATRYFVGRASRVAQVTSVVFSSVVATNTYSIAINGRSVSAVAGSTSLADLVAALVEAWNTSAQAEHQEMVASEYFTAGPTLAGVQLTARTAGVPSTVTATASTGSATVTDQTAAAGPEFWKLAANWDGGTLPSGADDLVIENYSGNILYGLTDTLNYASVKFRASFTGLVGLPDYNALGYTEYRTKRLTLGSGSAVAVEIGAGAGVGSGRIRLDTQTSNTTFTVHRSANSTTPGFPAVELNNAGAGSVVRVYGGTVQVRASTVATANVYRVQNNPESALDLGTCTVTTLNCVGGTAYFEGTVTNVVARNAAVVTSGGAATSANVTVSENARLNWNSSGGITTMLTVQPGGTADFGQVATAKTVAACQVFADGQVLDPMGVVAWTAGVALQGCRIGDVTVDLGVGYVL